LLLAAHPTTFSLVAKPTDHTGKRGRETKSGSQVRKNHYHPRTLKPLGSPSQNSFFHNQKLALYPSSNKMKEKSIMNQLSNVISLSHTGVLLPLSSTSPLLISRKNISKAFNSTIEMFLATV
jgi:hypothetical protein